MPSVIRQSIAGLNVRKELVNGDSESGSDLSDVTLASDDAQFLCLLSAGKVLLV